jgi:hypothetical protein
MTWHPDSGSRSGSRLPKCDRHATEARVGKCTQMKMHREWWIHASQQIHRVERPFRALSRMSLKHMVQVIFFKEKYKIKVPTS